MPRFALFVPDDVSVELPEFVEVEVCQGDPWRAAAESGAPLVAVASNPDELSNCDWMRILEVFDDEATAAAIGLCHEDHPCLVAPKLLPRALSVLAFDPGRSSVIVFRGGELDEIPVRSRLVAFGEELAERVILVPPAASNHRFPAELLPALVPPKGSRGPGFLLEVIDAASPTASVRAGLLQLNDFLDESHTVAQECGGADGDYWHAIMHRREPDASNSKYWWRRVGQHPVFESLYPMAQREFAEVDEPLGNHWDPAAFVDLCERARQARDVALIAMAQRVQFQEMLLLLAHCAG